MRANPMNYKKINAAFAAGIACLCPNVLPTANADTTVPADYYNYDAGATYPVTVTEQRSTPAFRLSEVTYPSPVDTGYPANDLVKAYFYDPTTPGPHPVVIVYHEWLPKNLKLDESLCERLANVGIAALMVIEPFSQNRRPLPHVPEAELLTPIVPRMVRNLRQSIVDGRRGLDWVLTQPNIDSNHVGVAGISLGAMLAALYAGAEPRVSLIVSLDGGADISDIIWNSPMTHALRVKIARQGIDYSQFQDLIAPVEPKTWIKEFDPKNAFLVNGRYDLIVRPDQAVRLGSILGGARVVWMNTGHYGLALGEAQISDVGVHFLKERFAGKDDVRLPSTLKSGTIEVGLLLGRPEYITPALSYHLFNFDEAGRFAITGQLGLHGPAVAGAVRLSNVVSVGMRWPVSLSHGRWKEEPFILVHAVL